MSNDISAFQGFGVEFFITFVLVFTVFASCDKKRTDLRGSAPLLIGLSVTVCHLFAVSSWSVRRFYMEENKSKNSIGADDDVL